MCVQLRVPESVDVRVGRRVGVGDRDADRDPDTVGDAVNVTVCVAVCDGGLAVPVRVGRGVAVAVGVRVAVWADGVADETVLEGDAVPGDSDSRRVAVAERDGDVGVEVRGESDTEGVCDRVGVGAPERLEVRLAVGEAVGEQDGGEGLWVAVGGVAVGDALEVRVFRGVADGEAEAVAEALKVHVRLTDGVTVAGTLGGDGVAVGVGGEREAVRVRVREKLVVGPLPEGVRVRVGVRDRLAVGVPVVKVREHVRLGVGGEMDRVAVALRVSGSDMVAVGEGEWLRSVVVVTVGERGVGVGEVGVRLGLLERVRVREAVWRLEWEGEPLGEGERLHDGDRGVGVPLRLPVLWVRVGVGVRVSVSDTVSTGDPDRVGLPDHVPAGLGVRLGVDVAVGEAVAERVCEFVRRADGMAETEGVCVDVGLGVGVGVGVGVELGLAEVEEVHDTDRLCDVVPVTEWDGDEAEALRVLLRVQLRLAETVEREHGRCRFGWDAGGRGLQQGLRHVTRKGDREEHWPHPQAM